MTDSLPLSAILLQAIAQKLCITATYNRGKVLLAPHILYTRHGDLHLDATTLYRDGREKREQKLGTYKVSGLTDLALSVRRFDADAQFNPDDDRYAGVALFAVER